MLRKDNLLFGIILGFLVPILGSFIYYFLVFYTANVSFFEYLFLLKEQKNLLTAGSSISLIANAIVFTLYINGYRDKTAKGIFLATLIFAIAILLVKVIG